MAVNKWRGKISPHVELECLLYNTKEPESVIHHFWDSPQAQATWKFLVVVLSTLLPEGPLASFDAQYAFFTQKMLQRFQYCGAIWVFLQSTTLWTL